MLTGTPGRDVICGLGGKDIWEHRFKSIRGFERHLARNGVLILKFFLHVSKEEQRKRFLARLEEPAKRWKFEMGDVAERKLWDKYMHAYEAAIRHTPLTVLTVNQTIAGYWSGAPVTFSGSICSPAKLPAVTGVFTNELDTWNSGA